MGNSQSSQNRDEEASSLKNQEIFLSHEEAENVLCVLKDRALEGNVMACYDAGFMMIQGIGCWRDWREGLKLIIRGSDLEENEEDESWKLVESVTKRIEPQIMFLRGLFFVCGFVLF